MLSKIIKITAINIVLLAVFLEILLRIFWTNPYVRAHEGAYIHHANMHIRLRNIADVYEGAPDPIYFNTSSLGYVENSKTKSLSHDEMPDNFALALGGSTTECVTVQEDYRWPDLLDTLVLNYSGAGLYSYHTYFNILHILEKQHLRPKYIFIMDGLNNISNYLQNGPEAFNVNDPDKKLMSDPFRRFVAKNFYTIAFLKRLPKYRSFPQAYKESVLENQSYPLIGSNELDSWINENKLKLKETLIDIYGRMNDYAGKYGIEVLVLTQPHSFRENYKPYNGNDLRYFPLLNGKRMNYKQAEELMNLVNDITIEVADRHGLHVIDVAGCFADTDVSPLIYDGWHFTQKGSEYFAECVNPVKKRFEINRF